MVPVSLPGLGIVALASWMDEQEVFQKVLANALGGCHPGSAQLHTLTCLAKAESHTWLCAVNSTGMEERLGWAGADLGRAGRKMEYIHGRTRLYSFWSEYFLCIYSIVMIVLENRETSLQTAREVEAQRGPVSDLKQHSKSLARCHVPGPVEFCSILFRALLATVSLKLDHCPSLCLWPLSQKVQGFRHWKRPETGLCSSWAKTSWFFLKTIATGML